MIKQEKIKVMKKKRFFCLILIGIILLISESLLLAEKISYFQKGITYYKNGEYVKALKVWRKVSRRAKNWEKVARYIKHTEEKLAKIKEEEKKEKTKSLLKEGLSYYKEGNYALSKEKWQQVRKVIDSQDKKRVNRYIKEAKSKLKAEEAKKRKEADGYYEEGKKYYKKKDYTSAVAHWKKTLALDPHHLDALEYMEEAKAVLIAKYGKEGENYYKEGEYEKAISRWKRILELNPHHKVAAQNIKEAKKELVVKHYLKGEIYYENKDYNAALSEWEEVLLLDTFHTAAEEGVKKARLELRKIELERKKAEYYKQGEGYFKNKEYDKAVEQWEKVLALDTAHQSARKGIKKAELALKRIVEEKERKTEIAKYLSQAEDYLHKGSYEDALREYEKVLKLDASHYAAQKGIKKVKLELRKVAEAQEKEKEIAKYYEQGETYFNKGEYEKAIAEWEKVLKLDAVHKKAMRMVEVAKLEIEKVGKAKEKKTEIAKYLSQAEDYLHKGSYEDALREYEKVLKLDDSHQVAQEGIKKVSLKFKKRRYLEGGKTYFEKGEYEKAMAEWKLLKELDPQNKEVDERIKEVEGKLISLYYAQGANYFKNKKYKEAIKQWEKVLAFDISYQSAQKGIKKARKKLILFYYNQGTDYYKKGKYEKAIAEWAKVLTMEEGKETHLSAWDKILQISVYKKAGQGIEKAKESLKKK